MIFFFFLFFFISCKKENPGFLSYNIYNVGENIPLKKIFFKDSITCFTCGGFKNAQGAIFRSSDAAITWQKVFESSKYCINDLFFLDDSIGYACGDSLTLFKTSDSGRNWEQYFFPNLPWNQYMIPYNSIYVKSETEIFLAGGEHYSKGCITHTLNGDGGWNHPSFDNEFNCLTFTDANTAYISGYGVIYKTSDGGNTFYPLTIRGDWYKSMFFFDNLTGFTAGYDGGLYKTTDGGTSWQTKISGNDAFGKRVHFNAVFFTDSNTGYIAASGGRLYKSADGGSSWHFSVINENENLQSVCASSERKVYVCSDKGRVYEIK
ncbi:MAG: hypothetical protein A2275_07790 [Bacteroidetes bacterium RIFOXYA12_FULL_35_11]|nr:MAG: hypothetical protein A2X01_18285 [Bacteroidetes bacterium GWF2_35_48]OFY76427.1 MAG: hypothetical protein A2275_07790 [Bacteroidetes bacterium RIFOXYA12_FULL_35_11]OFY94430.1 MAG: hypothetical protein A2309_03180 [Bacteroidetes bacterium RIFOXYB2_FULL_35_7]OFZ00678.1 MAG: hypothetical protein A2491_14980 [Bacteroidetes bacterium RIFOXYC12_FULL_35_7]